MPAPRGRDLDVTRSRLEGWFAARLPQARDLRVSGLSGPGTTGFSNDTLMFDLDWREGSEARREALVVRIKPTGHQVFPEYDLARQFRIQSLLAETDVPVARMFWEEAADAVLGAPFYVMERVDGRIPTDNPPYHVGGWVIEIAPEERAALWWSGLDVLTRIHGLDWKGLGLAFLERPERGETPLDRELSYYERYLEWAWGRRGEPHPVCTPALAWLRAHRPSEPEPTVLCWGDARIGNMMEVPRWISAGGSSWTTTTAPASRRRAFPASPIARPRSGATRNGPVIAAGTSSTTSASPPSSSP
jgi:aminoglycoside phosphotransferase (APT) family kinase protein